MAGEASVEQEFDINWDEHDEASGTRIFDPGVYLCKISDVYTNRTTEKGDPYWSLMFTVVHDEEGDDTNRGCVFFDNITFSKAGTGRAKLLARCVGCETSGTRKFSSNELKGKYVLVDITKGKDNRGNDKMQVSFAGYSKYEGPAPVDPEQTNPSDPTDTPF
jgi:hypothetical protein